MTSDTNHLGQPVGHLVPDWRPPVALTPISLTGRYCRLEPLDAGRHIQPLFDALAEEETGALWTYLPIGPYASAAELAGFANMARDEGWVPFAILDTRTNRPLGSASYMRINTANGSAEIGAVIFSPALQRSRLGTEAIFLMMDHMFQAGYRRCEWKCNALNTASRQAARRLGFSHEGVFRQSMVVKGRNRDTAWYSCLDCEWPAIRAAILTWLAPRNFDANGHQKRRLSETTRPLLQRSERA